MKLKETEGCEPFYILCLNTGGGEEKPSEWSVPM